MEVVWNIPEYVCLCYIGLLAEEIKKYSLPTKVFCVIRERESEALKIIYSFKSRNISVWIKSAGGRSKFVMVPPSLDEDKLNFLLNTSQALNEGKKFLEL